MENFTFYAQRPNDSYRKTDAMLIVSILLLWGLGLFTVFFSTSARSQVLFDNKYHFFVKQIIWSAVGFALMIFMTLFPMNKIRRYVPLVTFASLFLCLLPFVPFMSEELKGAHRWISIGPLSFQPSELAKFAMILFLSNYLAKEEESMPGQKKSFFVPLMGILIFSLIVLLQRDFSTAVLFFLVGVILLFVSGARMWWVFPCLALVIPMGIYFIFGFDYRSSRIQAFFNPEAYRDSSGHQFLSSKNAIASAGFWGSGLGSGLTLVYKIPEVVNDYIFAGWASALGFIGVLLYFVVLTFFMIRAVKIALDCPNVFAAYGTFGCASFIVLQSLVNCAVVCGVLPTTGIPLPFFSTGGSSLLMTFVMCGFMLNASHCDEGKDFVSSYEDKNENIESIGGVVVEYE